MKREAFEAEMRTHYCIDLDTRDRQVIETLSRGYEAVAPAQDHDEPIAVVCYGPSLHDTWEELRSFRRVMTCSGAHRFLLERGIVPMWHCEVDPRRHKVDLIGPPNEGVEYLVASVCHPEVFAHLKGMKVKVWHVFANESARNVAYTYPRGEWAITGGGNVGMRALSLARFMGFRNITVFGMDYSFRESQHAGPHPKEHPQMHTVEVAGVEYKTNPAMHKQAQDFFKEIVQFGRINIDFRGEGLLQAKIREHGKLIPDNPSDGMAGIGAASPQVISPQYLELTKQLHASRPDYGTSGSKRTGVVKKLIEAVKPQSILDYGCGKGTLAQSLPFPIWEYDPAIPGKDQPPRPADMVICTDVLEHVEPEYLPSVLMDLSRVVLKVGYIIINTGPAQKTLADGRNAHLIQKPLEWWKERLEQFFAVARIEQGGAEVMAIVAPRKKKKPVLKAAPKVEFSWGEQSAEAAPEKTLLDRIAAAPVIEKPFPHVYIEDVFTPGMFAALQGEFASGDGWKTLEEARGTQGYPQRFVKPFASWLNDGRLRQALDVKFGTRSEKSETLLMRDGPGYGINPHTDTPKKVVTALFYMTRDWTEKEHGTSIYSPLIKAFSDPVGKHHEREGFRMEWAAPGKPNSVLIFARTDTSFHGCEPYRGDKAREILLFDTR